MVADRIYIDEDTLDFYDNSKILNNHKIDRKDQFLVAMAYGVMANLPPIEIKKKKGLFLTKNLKENEMSLFYSIAIKEKDVHCINDLDDVYSIVQEYANLGIRLINRLEEKCSFEQHMKQFEKVITDHMKTLDLDTNE
jgi:hypothetical protein